MPRSNVLTTGSVAAAADLEGTGVSANDDAASIDLYGDIAGYSFRFSCMNVADCRFEQSQCGNARMQIWLCLCHAVLLRMLWVDMNWSGKDTFRWYLLLYVCRVTDSRTSGESLSTVCKRQHPSACTLLFRICKCVPDVWICHCAANVKLSVGMINTYAKAYLCSADGGRDDYASLYGGETPSTQQAQGGVEQQTAADVVGPAENGKAEHPSDSGDLVVLGGFNPCLPSCMLHLQGLRYAQL